MPGRGGWVIEHVEACHQDVVTAFKPSFAILVEQDVQNLLRTADARSMIAGESSSTREMRALNSALTARRQYDGLEGAHIGQGEYWKLKKLAQP
jgi:hypothetical protein